MLVRLMLVVKYCCLMLCDNSCGMNFLWLLSHGMQDGGKWKPMRFQKKTSDRLCLIFAMYTVSLVYYVLCIVHYTLYTAMDCNGFHSINRFLCHLEVCLLAGDSRLMGWTFQIGIKSSLLLIHFKVSYYALFKAFIFFYSTDRIYAVSHNGEFSSVDIFNIQYRYFNRGSLKNLH